jgi:WD40 repeat protein/serine/threonine protein kinase
VARMTIICEKCGAKYQVKDSSSAKIALCDDCRAASLSSRLEATVFLDSSAAEQEANAGVHPESWNIGDVILDTYEVLPVIENGEEKAFHGAGGMGKVFKIHSRDWDMDMAVKVPRAEFFQNASHRENFVRECHTWMDLGIHPHVVTCGFVRVLGDVPCVFAEYVDGGSLKNWIDSRKLYEGGHEKSLERILDIAIQFARGLDYAHEKKMIHQDVKPANLLLAVGEDGRITAKVGDFGLVNARAATGESTMAIPEQSILATYGGMTRAYCSPEQADMDAKRKARVPRDQLPKLTRRTDIWSWAVSVFEMFTGGVTWEGGQVVGASLEDYLDMGIEDGDIPAMPEPLAELLRQCFQRSPDERPKAMSEVAEALESAYKTVTDCAYPHDFPTVPTELADVLNNKALSFMELGMADRAWELWEEALRLDVHHPASTYNYGLDQWRRGAIMDDELVRRLDAVRTTHTDDRQAKYLLGCVHLERGDVDGAVSLLRSAAEAAEAGLVRNALEVAERKIDTHARCVRTFKGPRGMSSVASSADGRYALSGSRGETLDLWDLSSGRCVRTLEGHASPVRSVALSAEGRYGFSGSQDGALQFWDLSSGRCVRAFEGHAKSVFSVALSADGHYGLSGSWNPALRLWDLSSGRCVRTFEGHTDFVASVALSADSRYGFSGSYDKTLKLWDLSSGRCVQTFEGHANEVSSVALSADGRYGFSGSYDRTLKLWDLSSGRCVRTFEGHANPVRSVALSSDGRHGFSGSEDKTLKLWDLSSGRCVRTFKEHAHKVISVGLSTDCRYGLSGSLDSALKLWDLASILDGHFVGPAAYSEAWQADLGIAQERRYMQILREIEAGEACGDIASARESLSAAMELPGRARSPDLREWNRRLGRYCRRAGFRIGWLARTFEGHAGGVTSVALGADGRYGLSGSYDKTLKLWDLSSGCCVRTFEGHAKAVTSVALGPDGRYGLSGSYDNTVKLWELSSGRCVRSFEGHVDSYVDRASSVALSADGRYGLWGRENGPLKLWDLSNGQCVRTFKGLIESVDSVALSADGRCTLQENSRKILKLWDLSSGQCVRIAKNHGSGVTSVALSVDCRYALWGNWSGALNLWDLSSGRCLWTIQGHATNVNSVALSADGHYGLSGGKDMKLKLWDLSNGRCVRTFEEHGRAVTSVVLSADGRYGLSGSEDGTMKLWELDWEHEFPGWINWDDGALPWLTNSLTLHSPGRNRFGRWKRPEWNDDDFEELMCDLSCAGYGWLRPEGVRKKLEEMTAKWKGPPPLGGKRSVLSRIFGG